MRSILAAFYAISLFGLGADTVNFDNGKPGAMPPYWTATVTHPGGPNQIAPHWEILKDGTAPSHQTTLAQVDSGVRNSEFGLAIYDKVIARDADLSVKFKITGGHGDRTAGIVFRYQDPSDYYLLHFSASESNIVLFRVRNGQARPIPIEGSKQSGFGVAHELHDGQWYVAKVSYRGPHFRVFFGNRRLFDASDDEIANAGKTGVWIRGGTTAEFDDFRLDKKH